MREYFTEAVVLDREPSGELDFRVSLFTKKFGKLMAKAKSARKITSKLSGHLLPGNIADVRLIEKNGLQVVDAIKKSSTSSGADLFLLNKILADAEPDPALWQKVISGNLRWGEVIKILGWDPEFALCSACAIPKPESFSIRGQEFFCRTCALRSGQKELLYL
ncbi:MAG: recombination protein O N-terminal domain-containing protein [Candidatus Liptonbacteria bacterium]|nr:recombination protein O N-terminal domain-containing protein [Candidatus Liptonbacteria bacterium]